MLDFKIVRWKNFLSTGNAFTEVDLKAAKMTLIVGDNGAGKSQILDAICFGLFNKPFRKINKPSIVNTITQKNALVEIEFDSNGQNYKIVRGLKPARFEIWQNGKLLSQTAANLDYQEMLEKQILKTTYKSFTQIVILGSATFTPFMKLTAADRREVLDDLLDIQIFTTMNVLAKQKISELKTEIATVETAIAAQKNKITFISNQISELKKNSDDHTTKLNDELARLRVDIETASKAKEECEKIIDSYLNEIADESVVTSKIAELTTIHTKIQTRMNALEKKVIFYEENDHCDHCEQPIDQSFKQEVLAKSNSERDELVKGAAKLIERLSDIHRRMEKIGEIKHSINNARTKIKVYDAQLAEFMKSENRIQIELENVNDNGSGQLLKQTIEEGKIEANNLIKMKDRRHAIGDEREVLEIALQILKDGGIKAQIIKQYLPIINQTINRYLNAMDFMVDFYLDENFNEIIKSRFRDEFSYDNFSEGEKSRIDLALLLTWRIIARKRNSVHTNLLIMDETMDSSMDTAGVETLINLLSSEMKGTNLFIISHRESMVDNFDRTIKVKKEGNFSVYESQ